MLTQDVIDALLTPVSEGSPCGDDLEYDPAFINLESAAQRKPEQQFGDTVIPTVEPEWPQVQEQAIALLSRSKDLRTCVLLLRASTRVQGLTGFVLGTQLLFTLLDKYWSNIHPALDADDDNDPTMRLNALTPLGDDALLVRDLYDVVLGDARGIGPIKVRDAAIARNVLSSNDAAYSISQVEGGLQEILDAGGSSVQAMRSAHGELTQLRRCVVEHSGRDDAVDVARLQSICRMLAQIAAGAPDKADGATSVTLDPTDPASVETSASSPGIRHQLGGPIQTRQQALQSLDQVIHFLEQTEPGNPAPLLIARAKRLIGVSFLDIINNLAPDAMSTIENVTGARANAEESD